MKETAKASPDVQFIDSPTMYRATPEVTAYLYDGTVVKTDEVNIGVAKEVKTEQGYNYYIKTSNDRNNLNGFLDPYGLLYKAGDENREERDRGRRLYEYRKVSQESFQEYLTYLSTRNPSRLRNAERIR